MLHTDQFVEGVMWWIASFLSLCTSVSWTLTVCVCACVCVCVCVAIHILTKCENCVNRILHVQCRVTYTSHPHSLHAFSPLFPPCTRTQHTYTQTGGGKLRRWYYGSLCSSYSIVGLHTTPSSAIGTTAPWGNNVQIHGYTHKWECTSPAVKCRLSPYQIVNYLHTR